MGRANPHAIGRAHGAPGASLGLLLALAACHSTGNPVAPPPASAGTVGPAVVFTGGPVPAGTVGAMDG